MANPYGIEQVDVPGILGAYDAARERRVQMMLQQNQLEQQNQQLDRETKLHTAYAKFRVPGADSGAASAVSAYGGPTAPATSASPAAVAAPMDPNSPTDALASETTPAAPAAPSTAPAAAPAADPRHPMASWMESNTPAIQDAMRADPVVGMQMIQNFSSLDAATQQRVKAHLELADELNEHAIRHLATVHDQASWDAARTGYAAELKYYGAPVPDLPTTYDPQFVQGLRLSALSTKDQLEQMKPIVMGADSAALDPITHQVIASNPKDDLQHFVVHNADGSDTPYAFNPKTGETHQLTEGGAIAGGSSTPAGNVQRTHGYTPRQSNGGDNSDVVVNNKIAALSHAVGVDPDTAMTPEQFQSFVRALPATEGSGNNNPGGIKDGAYARSQPGYAGAVGQYAKFTTPDAGTAAMAKLLQNNYYDKGQRSIRDIIEGRPVAGASNSAASGKPITGTTAGPLSDEAARLAAAVYKYRGTLPAGIARTKGDLDKVMNFAAQMPMDEARQIAEGTVQQWQTTHAAGQTLTAFEKGPQANQVRSLNVAIQHIDLLRQAATALQNGNITLFNSIGQHIAQMTGGAAPTNFDSLKNFVTDEVTKGVIGTSGGVQDREHAAQIISRASSPAQLLGAFNNFQGLLTGQAHGLQQQYEAGTGRHDFADKYLLPRTRELLLGQTGGPAGHGASIPTLTPDQARSAPPGTVFHTTDGRTMRKH